MAIVTKKQDNDPALEQDMLFFWDHGKKAHMLHIQHDDDTQNPRKDMDHFTVMACFHPRHALGDDTGTKDAGAFWAELVKKNVPGNELRSALLSGRISVPYEPDDEPMGAEELMEALYDWIEDGDRDAIAAAMELLKDRLACLPLWLYDHSGLTVSCGERTYPYNDRFDSSALGWIVALKSDVLAELQCVEAEWEAKAEACMRAEVGTYDRWLRGDVWAACHYMADGCVGCNEDGMKAGKRGAAARPMSGADNWDDGEWTCGFYGDGILSSGIAECIGCGLPEAIKSGNYWTGAAESHTVTVWDYVRDA